MSSVNIKTFRNHLEVLMKRQWMDRPEEIEQLERRKGAWGCTFAVHFNCMRETQEVLELIWLVRNAVKGGRLSLEMARSFLGNALLEKSGKMIRYYKIREFPEILEQVGMFLPVASSEKEFFEITNLLLLYVGRYNFWLDAGLDWKALSETHERGIRKREME